MQLREELHRAREGRGARYQNSSLRLLNHRNQPLRGPKAKIFSKIKQHGKILEMKIYFGSSCRRVLHVVALINYYNSTREHISEASQLCQYVVRNDNKLIRRKFNFFPTKM